VLFVFLHPILHGFLQECDPQLPQLQDLSWDIQALNHCWLRIKNYRKINLFMKGQLNDIKELRILGGHNVLLNQGLVKSVAVWQ